MGEGGERLVRAAGNRLEVELVGVAVGVAAVGHCILQELCRLCLQRVRNRLVVRGP